MEPRTKAEEIKIQDNIFRIVNEYEGKMYELAWGDPLYAKDGEEPTVHLWDDLSDECKAALHESEKARLACDYMREFWGKPRKAEVNERKREERSGE